MRKCVGIAGLKIIILYYNYWIFIGRVRAELALVSPGVSLQCYSCPDGTSSNCEVTMECNQGDDTCLKITSGGEHDSKSPQKALTLNVTVTSDLLFLHFRSFCWVFVTVMTSLCPLFAENTYTRCVRYTDCDLSTLSTITGLPKFTFKCCQSKLCNGEKKSLLSRLREFFS